MARDDRRVRRVRAGGTELGEERISLSLAPCDLVNPQY